MPQTGLNNRQKKIIVKAIQDRVAMWGASLTRKPVGQLSCSYVAGSHSCGRGTLYCLSLHMLHAV